MASLPTPAGHLLKNIALLAISLLLFPLNTAIFLSLDLLSRLTGNHGVVKTTPRENRKTILVTGLNMTKGLVLARLFHKAGHRVIGADTNPLAPGRLSRALDEFHVLPRSDASGIEDPYIKKLLSIIQKDSVDLWVSASDVNGAMADALAKDLVEKQTTAKAVQFGEDAISTLHEKDTFMEHTQSLGLTIPDSEVVHDRESIINFLTKRGGLEKKKQGGVQYLVKPIGVDDLGRNDMPLLPLDSEKETLQRIEAMPLPKTDKPAYIIQQFITGPEYCTHALIVRGQVRSFVACPSSDMLMHYTALPASSALHRAMLEFTQKQAASFEEGLTGHMSFDFLVQQDEKSRMEEKMEEAPTLYPIECNPRVHTAIVLLRDTLDTVDSYLSVLSPSPASRPMSSIDFIPSHPQQYYWIGHDLVELVLYHLYLTVVVGTMTPSQYCESLRVFANHVVNWQDGLLETWDPWPCWWLYHVYWPVQFVGYLFNGRWHKINVSTGKAFKAA